MRGCLATSSALCIRSRAQRDFWVSSGWKSWLMRAKTCWACCRWQAPCHQGIITGLLQLLDGLRSILKTIEAEGSEGDGEDSALIVHLEQLQDATTAVAQTAHTAAAASGQSAVSAPAEPPPAPVAPVASAAPALSSSLCPVSCGTGPPDPRCRRKRKSLARRQLPALPRALCAWM